MILDTEYIMDGVLYGSILGYYSSNCDNLKNYLESRSTENEYNICSVNIPRPYAVMSNLFVEEQYRGQGVGKWLLEQFIEKAIQSSAKCIYSQADTVEKNNFDLLGWYKEYGFYQVDEDVCCCPIIRLGLQEVDLCDRFEY